MASCSRCPIPADPGYEHKATGFSSSRTNELSPLARVRPEAVEIARLATAGTIANLLTNSCSLPPFPSSRKPRSPPKDHVKANWRRIREIAYLRKQKEQNVASHRPHVTIKDRYQQVPSRVECFRQTPHLPNPSTSTQPFKAHRPKLPLKDSTTQMSSKPLDTDPHHLPQNEPVTIQPKTRRNFVAENVHCASNVRPKRPARVEQQESHMHRQAERFGNYQRGAVPKYLKDRQEQWRREEEERIANLPDPSIPPGHILMPHEDQYHTLEVLKKNQIEFTRQLQALSITSDSLLVRNRRSELEGQLAELEDAIKIFSRPKVFIKMD